MGLNLSRAVWAVLRWGGKEFSLEKPSTSLYMYPTIALFCSTLIIVNVVNLGKSSLFFWGITYFFPFDNQISLLEYAYVLEIQGFSYVCVRS